MARDYNRSKSIKITIGLFFLFLGTVIFPFSARADTLNQNQTFYVDNTYDTRGRSSVEATLRYVSEHAYGYVEDEYWNSISKNMQDSIINQLGIVLTEFDTRIYPIETQFFGAEPPAVNNDPKITILFNPLIENAGGYFNGADDYKLNASNNQSNQRKMFYVNVATLSDTDKIKTFLAHEFQHLISLNQKEFLHNISDDTWFNELRSEYAITLLGYNDNFSNSNLQRRLQSFLAQPSDSLTEWKNKSSDYGQVAIFGEYLTEHWTNSIIPDSLKSDSIGIISLNRALAKNGFNDSFIDVFRDWGIANIINDSKIDPRYGYLRNDLKNFRVIPTKVINNLGDNIVFATSDDFKDWQGHWYDISQLAPGKNDFLKISFFSPSLTSFQVSYVIFKTNGDKIFGDFKPNSQKSILAFSGMINNISRIILIPFKKDKLTGFGANETPVSLSFTAERVNDAADAVIDPYLMPEPDKTEIMVKPSDFGLKEGDFIRAEGDNDIFIINDYGYKRLVLSPKICLLYGHLGARGCFSAVKIVSTSVRDAFKTSWLFTNGENRDGKVYFLKPTGEDIATLEHVRLSGSDFINDGGDFNSVFIFNSREQSSYPLGPEINSIPIISPN